MTDPVNHPPHYTKGPTHSVCGQVIECIEIAEGQNFNRGNAYKYLWRADRKGKELEDLMKARWYIDREIARVSAERARQHSRDLAEMPPVGAR